MLAVTNVLYSFKMLIIGGTGVKGSILYNLLDFSVNQNFRSSWRSTVVNERGTMRLRVQFSGLA